KILGIRYEELVADPQPQVHRLLRHCDLEFEESCMHFHRNRRPVSTLSQLQVRQPIYRSSVGRWKNYEKHLGPLIAALDDSEMNTARGRA
ncbi:MAG: sulfotransferase, partial [Gammaproteobacteria bacterium]